MLKVLKCINLGSCMYSGDKKDRHEKFLFSFFELNNGKIVDIMLIEYWNKEIIINYEFDCYFTNYKFGMNWNDWWNSTFQNKDEFVDLETEEFIKHFYTEKLLDKRHIKTDVIENNIN